MALWTLATNTQPLLAPKRGSRPLTMPRRALIHGSPRLALRLKMRWPCALPTRPVRGSGGNAFMAPMNGDGRPTPATTQRPNPLSSFSKGPPQRPPWALAARGLVVRQRRGTLPIGVVGPMASPVVSPTTGTVARPLSVLRAKALCNSQGHKANGTICRAPARPLINMCSRPIWHLRV